MALINHRQSGMTLLEVLVAITLMVIIAAIAFVSLNGLIDAKNHTDQVAQELRNELLVSRQLNQDIYAMINRPIKNELGSTLPAIIGAYSSIEFSRNGHVNPLKQNRADLQRVQWYVRNNNLYRRSINQLDPGSFPSWTEREYLSEVKQLSISYMNSVGIESRVWPLPENPDMLLRSIKLTITLNNDSKLKYQWYPLL